VFSVSHPGGSNQKPPTEAGENEVEFNDIEFRRRDPVSPNDPDAVEKPYRIYKSRTDFVEIMASSAKEAMEKTGVKSPTRIVRMDLERAAVLPPSFFKDAQPAAVENTAESATTPPAESSSAAPEAPAAVPEAKA
jgi:hypothetical protein